MVQRAIGATRSRAEKLEKCIRRDGRHVKGNIELYLVNVNVNNIFHDIKNVTH